MKKLLIPLFLCAGCASTTFQKIDGAEPIHGDGGIIHSTVDTVTVFSSGLPSGTICHPIGVIDDSRKNRLLEQSAETAAATTAAQYGANVISRISESTNYDLAKIRQYEADKSAQQGQVTINIEQPYQRNTMGTSSYGQIMASNNRGCSGFECFAKGYNSTAAYQPTYNSQFVAFFCVYE